MLDFDIEILNMALVQPVVQLVAVEKVEIDMTDIDSAMMGEEGETGGVPGVGVGGGLNTSAVCVLSIGE